MQHLVANWHVDRAKTEEWEAIWQQLQEIALESQGFKVSRLMRSAEHPGKYTVYAQWHARDDWEQYFKNPRVQELIRSTYRLIKAPPFQEWFDLVSETGSTS